MKIVIKMTLLHIFLSMQVTIQVPSQLALGQTADNPLAPRHIDLLDHNYFWKECYKLAKSTCTKFLYTS